MNTPTFLNTALLAEHLGAHRPAVALHLYDSIDSTNSEAKRVAQTESGISLHIARTQTAGRGRLGRSFHSPATGLYMTLAYTTNRPLEEAATVTATAAVATATAIEALTGKRPDIKWVNDLYLDGGKLAGILTEAIPLAEERRRILVGIGVNLTTTEFPDGLRAPAASLFAPQEAERQTPAFLGALLGALAGEIASRLLLAVENPASAPARLADYRDRLLYVGRRVICTRGNEAFEGTLLGVDERYSLLVEAGGEVRVLSSGEISVRPSET